MNGAPSSQRTWSEQLRKAVIKSQGSGIIAAVGYSMTLECLTRVQITVLVKS